MRDEAISGEFFQGKKKACIHDSALIHPSQGFRCAADAACAIHDHAHCNPSQGFARASPGHLPPRLRRGFATQK